MLDERKVVSVLFCDLVGFTAACEQADPEDVVARIRPYHALLRREVERFGGTVEKFVGDGVMAVFGAPVAHEDDPERAVRAGLRILDAIGELNQADPTLGLQVRVGINTGEALVAPSDGPAAGEAIVTLGDVVNTASRLQTVAPVGGIAVSTQTYRATERVFRYELMERVAMKGKAEAQQVWRPLEALVRLGSDAARTHTTPLVGREPERARLIEAFERVVRDGSCQLVTLVGEPGIGKSRLCFELFRSLRERSEAVVCREGRCLPYGEGIAMWALREIVKSHCGVLESDPPSEALVKLERALAAGDPDRDWLMARLEPLVGVGGEPASQQESFAAWRRFLESLATDGPAVICFEDLHWADEGLLSFLEHLAASWDGGPMLLMCTARPQLYERHPQWCSRLGNATELALDPLTEAQTARLLMLLVGQSVFPSEAQRRLLDRTGGNPLYAEELVRLMADRRMLSDGRDDAPVPDSVQALIAARIDTLPAEHKRLLQHAAIIGKVFWTGALTEMGDRGLPEVVLALRELADKQLLRPAAHSSMEGEQEYGFWHVLVRDVCYAQMPRAVRLSGHRKAAAWIERKAGERADDLAELIAHHYLQALELARSAKQHREADVLAGHARRWLALAGEQALAFDVSSAAANLDQALTLTPADHPARPRLLEHWAQAAQQQGRLHDARTALEQAIRLYREHGEAIPLGRALTALVTVLWAVGDQTRHQTIAEAVTVLEAQPAGPELVAAYEELAGKHLVDSEWSEVVEVGDRAAALASRLRLSEPARALGFVAGARCQLGDRQGIDDLQRALELSLKQGKGRAAAVHHFNRIGGVHDYDGPGAALACAREAEAFCRRRGITEIALMVSCCISSLLAELGETDDALARAARLAEVAEATGMSLAITTVRALQVRVCAERGEARRAAEMAAPLLAGVRVSGTPQELAAGLEAAAQALLGVGDRCRADELVHELGRVPGVRTDEAYARIVPGLLRCAIRIPTAIAPDELARWCPDDITPLRRHALASCRAQLAEHAAERSEAAALYADAARRWREFGNVPEHAYARLGQGRCLSMLRDPGAEAPLAEARELFAAMGYRRAAAEADALLGHDTAAAL
jgi:class 3 adenylate cyclase